MRGEEAKQRTTPTELNFIGSITLIFLLSIDILPLSGLLYTSLKFLVRLLLYTY